MLSHKFSYTVPAMWRVESFRELSWTYCIPSSKVWTRTSSLSMVMQPRVPITWSSAPRLPNPSSTSVWMRENMETNRAIRARRTVFVPPSETPKAACATVASKKMKKNRISSMRDFGAGPGVIFCGSQFTSTAWRKKHFFNRKSGKVGRELFRPGAERTNQSHMVRKSLADSQPLADANVRRGFARNNGVHLHQLVCLLVKPVRVGILQAHIFDSWALLWNKERNWEQILCGRKGYKWCYRLFFALSSSRDMQQIWVWHPDFNR